MYEVIKEFAGVEVGTKRNFSKSGAEYLQKEGYIKPIQSKKADVEAKGRKKKIDLEAEKLQNKSV